MERQGVSLMAKRTKKGYEQKSPAICVVAYDLQGTAISEETARRVVDAVEKATEKEGLAILYTRQ
jgi:hypothetical protein